MARMTKKISSVSDVEEGVVEEIVTTDNIPVGWCCFKVKDTEGLFMVHFNKIVQLDGLNIGDRIRFKVKEHLGGFKYLAMLEMVEDAKKE